MQRCLDLAQRGAGSVSPNPMVGAVLVFEDKIIGEGWHQAWGQAHAEVNCFASVRAENQKFIAQSTLYCSLEPCSHYGKTPPCVDLVLQHKVPRVVVANTDPNPLVAGKGLAKLRDAGVAVVEGILAEEGAWLNRFFFHWITYKRPYVILKWACSSDGFLGKKGKRTPISNKPVQRLVHRWRAETDAILVGAGTAIVDDPRLDTRRYFGKNPLRILLDGNGIVPLDRKLLSDDAPSLIFGPERSGLSPEKETILAEEIIPVTDVLDALRKKNRATLLVEGGAMVLQQFLVAGQWDELRIIENPRPIGDGVEAPKIPAGAMLRERYQVGDDNVSVYVRQAQATF